MIVIYNICGISGKENVESYITSINSILNQDFKNYKLIISSCLNSTNAIDVLKETFKNKIYINNIKDRLPVNITFNHSYLESIKRFNNNEDVIYIDSGCTLTQNNILSELENLSNTNLYGMISIRTNTNTGFPMLLGIGNHDDDSENFNKYFRNLKEHFEIPVGAACNLHCQLFSKNILNFYGKPLPDIFAGESTESVLSFLNAGIHKKWIIHKDIEIDHKTSMDGPSSGFLPWVWVMSTGRQPYDHPFVIDSILPRIQNGLKYGLGYEEGARRLFMHDESAFDENKYAKNPILKNYIKENLYLTTEEFDYNKINYEWI